MATRDIPQPLTAAAFAASDGVGDWRVVDGRAVAHFPTGGFTHGAAFVMEVARVADTVDHHPDADLRYGGVTMTLLTHETGTLTERDVDLARRISEVARAHGLAAQDGTATDEGPGR